MAAPALANIERAATVATIALNISQQTAIPQDHSNTNNKQQTPVGQKIMVDNAREYLEWHESYGVLIC